MRASHRGLAADEQEQLGIHGGTIRLSVGTESAERVLELVEMALDQV
jgi:cystathionine beta-lyase/cystathionine gamma-synthase